MYYKENRKGVGQMCQVVEEYGDLRVARATVEHVENLMETTGMSEQQACSALKISMLDYSKAKELLSSKEVSS